MSIGIRGHGHGDTDEILYHYTSFDAFLSIVQHSTVWATESKFLNDATEFQYGLKLADEISKSPDTHLSDAAKWFLESAERKLYTYVFSLSRQGDLLSQWRAYCPDGGVSIGFSRNDLEEVSKQHNFELVECVYNEEVQRSKIKEALEEEIDRESFYKKFPKLLASFKHPTFLEEEEVRLVSESHIYEQQQPYKPSWRATRTMPVQYTKIPLVSSEWGDHDSEPFRKVIVGPSTNQELVQRAVDDFIANNTTYGKRGRNPRGLVTVSSSQIPYRSK